MPSKPLLTLGFDTSGAWCGAALYQGDVCLAARQDDMRKGQAEQLFPLLEHVLRDGGAAWADLDCIGTGIGPGNFTGIRISVSAARGLGLSLGIPTVGVSLLEAFAYGADTSPVLSAVSAPREHAYIQGFRTAQVIDPTLTPIASISRDIARTDLTVIGTAGADVAAQIGATHAQPAFPIASAIAQIAAKRANTTHEPPAPLYLKAADAAPSSVPPVQIIPAKPL